MHCWLELVLVRITAWVYWGVTLQPATVSVWHPWCGVYHHQPPCGWWWYTPQHGCVWVLLGSLLPCQPDMHAEVCMTTWVVGGGTHLSMSVLGCFMTVCCCASLTQLCCGVYATTDHSKTGILVGWQNMHACEADLIRNPTLWLDDICNQVSWPAQSPSHHGKWILCWTNQSHRYKSEKLKKRCHPGPSLISAWINNYIFNFMWEIISPP